MATMRMGKTGSAIFILSLLFHWAAMAQETKVTVVASPNPVPLGESIQLRVEVQSALTTPVFAPTFNAPDFVKLNSQPALGARSVDIYANGERISYKASYFTYILQPKKEGTLFIRDIKVRVGTDTKKSEDIWIKVIGGGQSTGNRGSFGGSTVDDEDAGNPAAPNYSGGYVGGGSGSDLEDGLASQSPDRFNSDFTVFAAINKRRAYVGEPIIVEYYVYDFGGLRQTEIQKWPTFTGFWKEDLEIVTRIDFQDVYIQNEEMRRAFIGRYALYGIKPGKFPVDKLQVRGRYVSGNFFNPGGFPSFDMRTGIHASQDLTVEILPLPEEGRPANFGGGVGQFSMRLEADKKSLPQNSPITFSLILEGSGNFQAIDSIKLPLPKDFELYESNASSRASAPIGTRRELDSRKTFTYVAIPRKEGNFEIPSIEWSFFDPKRKAYQKISTEPFSIEVTPAKAGSDQTNTYLSKPAEGANEPPVEEQLRFLKSVDLRDSHARSSEPLQWTLYGLLALNMGLFGRLVARRNKFFSGLIQKADSFSLAKSDLQRAKKASPEEWPNELEEAVFSLVQVLLKSNPRGMPRPELAESWKAKGLPAPYFHKLEKVLSDLDQVRFSSNKSSEGNGAIRTRLMKETEELLREAGRIRN